MFLLNSPILLVTETCYSILNMDSRHPIFRRYEANLPNSLNWVIPIVLGYLPRAPVSVVGTDTKNPYQSLFMDPRTQLNFPYEKLLLLSFGS